MKKAKIFIISSFILSLTVLLTASTTGYFEISKNLDIFISLYKKVDELYVDELDHAKIMRKGIDAMLADLDPYTVYFSESEVEDFNFQRTGTYAGIGARISKLGNDLVVTEIYEGSPALEAGLKVGDILLSIDDKSVEGKSVADMSEILKGEENTLVKLKLKRNNEFLEKSFKRAEVKIDNVSYFGMVSPTIGYVKFENFREDAAQEVQERMEELKDLGMTKFILDMRGNPGGLLKEAVDIVNLFVESNKLVVATKGKNLEHSREYKTYKRPYNTNIPLVVLVDGGSASASEIVSGSIQDYDRGVVIGRNSYGKGLVQITQPLTYNAQLKVTTSKYYTASGRCIQRLDYASRDEEGNVPAVPDSLITKFETQNGRTVYDGAGINPDIEINLDTKSPFVKNLINEHYIFYFANNYIRNHSEFPSAKDFVPSEADLLAFQNYVNEKGFSYTTKTEKKLEALKLTLTGNTDSIAVMGKIDEFGKFLISLKSNDFDKNKETIRELLRLEIVEQLYLRKGKAEAALLHDQDVLKAIEVLDNPNLYNSILNPN